MNNSNYYTEETPIICVDFFFIKTQNYLSL